jgi:ADP-ribose pyrophosphatase YjhB (NUDIX family)
MWQELARHCPLCGTALALARVEARQRKRCPACSFVLFANPASAAAGLVLDARRRVLLVQRAIAPFRGCWALPAGFQEHDEEPAQTAAREVREEAGVEVEVQGLLELLFVPDDPKKPTNLAIYLCRPVGPGRTPQAGDDASAAAWFALDELPQPLGFASTLGILERLRDRSGYNTGPPAEPGLR